MTTKSPNILIIDDDRVSQIYLGELIETVLPDAQVVKADSGEQALELIKNNSFEYVFSDILMPGLSGETLFEELVKASERCSSCHIYAISGLNNPERKKIEKAGATAVLHKPLDRYLLEKVFFGNIVSNENDQLIIEKDGNEDFIDPGKIVNLYEGDFLKVAQILKLYQQTLPEQLESLGRHWKSKNYEEVRNLGHSLKNSFNYLGSEALKEKAYSLEEIVEGKTEEQYINQIVHDIVNAKKSIEDKLIELIDKYEKK